MRRIALVAVLTLGAPALASASPCMAGTLQTYLNNFASSGCEIGSASFHDFSFDVFDQAATGQINPTLVLVTPVESPDFVELIFSLDLDATAGVFLDGVIGYSVSALTPLLGGARVELSGASATPDGVVTVLMNVCDGGVFQTDPTDCQGSQLTPLLVFQDGFGNSELVANVDVLPFSSFFDVFTDIGIDGGPGGTTSLDGFVSNRFSTPQAVPEPSTLLMLGAGLFGVARRLKSKRPRHS
jgi:hypothetical protein